MKVLSSIALAALASLNPVGTRIMDGAVLVPMVKISQRQVREA
jgi:hypothetical protein